MRAEVRHLFAEDGFDRLPVDVDGVAVGRRRRPELRKAVGAVLLRRR